MKSITTQISQLILALIAIYLSNQTIASPAPSEEIDLNRLCSKFPLNSRCQDYDFYSAIPEQTQLEIQRTSLCSKFPQNSHCLQEPTLVMKIRLDRSGENDEWIRLERQNNSIKVRHTTRVKDALVSGIINAGLGFVPVPLPFIATNKHNWKDHSVISVSFQPDGCQSDRCLVTGINTFVLPEGMNIQDGLLTVQYQEKNLVRSLTFRIPNDVETETVNSIMITSPNSDALTNNSSL